MAFSGYPPDRRGSKDAPKLKNGSGPSGLTLEPAQKWVNGLGNWLIQRAQSLAGQPEKCQLIRKMTFDLKCYGVLPGWAWNRLMFNYSPHRVQFSQPVTESLFRVLPLATRLQSLILKQVALDIAAAGSLCNLNGLQVLTLDNCLIQNSVVDRVCSPDHSLSLLVPNLHLRFDQALAEGEAYSNQWPILCFCPSVVNLSLDVEQHSPLPPSRDVIPHWATSFGQLERLCMTLHEGWSDQLRLWVDRWREANPNEEPALTHLKWQVHVVSPSDSWQVFEPLSKMLSPNLKVLSLDGLPRNMASRSTIELIRECAPNLRGLTISARENDNQEGIRPMLWAEPFWRFADLVGSFPSLEHFEWNYHIQTRQATPAPLLAMERRELEGSSENDEYPFNFTGPLYFDDYHLAAAPFAALSSTLRTWVANRGNERASDEGVCLIRRKSEGLAISHVPASQVLDIGQWDIETLVDYPAWPNLLSKP
jgi:hypothetical protein